MPGIAMQKVRFTEFAELKQGDGKGPKYAAGKAYWLTDDQAIRWKSEGVAEDAPADMETENDRGDDPVRPEHIRIVRNGRRYDVVGPDEQKFNDEPLTAGQAEKLRQGVIAGEAQAIVPPAPAMEEPATPAPVEAPAADIANTDPPDTARDEQEAKDHDLF